MRWKTKTRHEHGDVKIVKKFALFPIRIGEEVRWLEMCKIKMTYWHYHIEMHTRWEYNEFVDD